METPPNNGPQRLNYMLVRRGEGEEDPARNQLLSRYGPKYQFIKKDGVVIKAERENVTKIMADMKKHTSYLQYSKWMFENSGEMNPIDHITYQNL